MNLGGTVKINKVGVILVAACFLLLFVYIFVGHSDDTSSKLLAVPDDENRVNMKALLVAAKEVGILHFQLRDLRLFAAAAFPGRKSLLASENCHQI